MSMIPQTLFNTHMLIDGISMQGDIPTLALPKVKVKTEGYRAGGMDAEIDMDMGLEKLESSFTSNGIRRETLKWFGVGDSTAMPLVFRGSFKGQKGASVPVIATMRGMVSEVDMGDWKPGEKAELKHSVSVTYYKLEVGGQTIYEIDPVNMVRVIDGVDQLAGIRSDLGL